MRKPKAILLDLGDTILETKKFDTYAGNFHCMQYLDNPKNYTASRIEEIANSLNKDIKSLRAKSKLEHSFESFQRLLYSHLDLSVKIDTDFELEFWKSCTEFVPQPDIFNVLDYLKENEIKTAVVSNTAFSGRILE